MKNKTYTIRISTIDNLYADYIVEAENLFFAQIRARNAFLRDYPDADPRVKTSITDPKPEIITEIIDIINKEGK